MTERSFFWTDGVGDGGAYSQDQMRLLFQALFGADDGVLRDELNEYAVSINGGDLRTATGRSVVNGTLGESDAIVDKTPTVPSGGTTGLRIVLRKDWSARTVRVALLQAADGTATPPAVTQTDGTTWEISLATAEITTGGTIQNLADTRTYVKPSSAATLQLAMIQNATLGGLVTTTSVTYVDYANVNAAVTVPAGEVWDIAILSSLEFWIQVNGYTGSLRLVKDGAELQVHNMDGSPVSYARSGHALNFYDDAVGAGTYTYKLQLKSNNASGTTGVREGRMVIIAQRQS